MKNKNGIVIASFLAVLICLILVVLLFCAVPTKLLIILALIIGIITGICITLLIHNLVNIVKAKRLGKV
jgi:uncharacterized membrane protein (DUF106 family)